MRHIAGKHELQIIYLQDADGAVQYILPLHRRTGKFGFGSGKAMLVCSYGLECSDNLGCLCAPELEDQCADLTADAINRFCDRNGVISLGHLDSSGDFPSRVEAAMLAGGRFTRGRPDIGCPAVDLPESWDAYLQKLSSNFRSQVRRSYKQVGGDGRPGFRSVDASDAEAFARDLMRLNRTRIREKGEVSSLENKAFSRFLEDVIPYMAAHGIAWMDTIVQNGEVLGSALHFVHGNTVYFYMGGFDDKASKIRPGTALFALVMQRAIESGYTRFDFLRGEEAYKYRWGATDVFPHNLTIYPSGFVRGHLISTLDDATVATRKSLKYVRSLVKRRG